MEEKKYLPIGTVVLLKGGKKEVMITGYCITPRGDVYDKKGKLKFKEGRMFDYGACLYPEGIISSDQSFAFNHDQIEKICFKGYVTDKQKEYSDYINREEAKSQKEAE